MKTWTYRAAKMTIWNPDAYSDAEVRDAAIFIQSKLDAKEEDLQQASFVLIYAPKGA